MSTETAPSQMNPYLVGQFAPVHDERDDVDLEVVGELPAALVGTFVRNGPNPAFPPLGRYHVFDGDGMIHSVALRDGKASYRNRYVESAGLQAERRAGHALFGGLAEFTMPPQDVIDRVGMMKNTANTNVVVHGGRMLALMEAARPTELGRDLATIGEFDFAGRLRGPMTAHPKVDPTTGEMLFFGYSPFAPYLRLHLADRDGSLVRSVDVDLPGPVMMHDFVVTSTRVVFFDLPAVFDLDAMLRGEPGIIWRPEAGARVGVLDRAGLERDVTWIEVDPFFVFHFLNGHDDGDTVVVDGCRADRLNATFGDEVLDVPVPPRLHRWRIDLAAGVVRDEPLDDRPGDFPRIDDRRAGLPARHGYLASTSGSWGDEPVRFDSVVRYDLRTGSSDACCYGDGVLSGEPVFAPDPGSDGGWLLNLVTDAAGDSELVVLDADALEVAARVRIPQRVPFGFHGNWVADTDW